MENKETAKVVNPTTAKEIANICKTCKECETHYKGLIESGIEKETAKSIIKEAKSIINNRKETAKTEKTAVKVWFADFERVGKSLLIGLLKEDDFSGIKSQTDKYGNISDFISEWITKADAAGQPIHKSKGVWRYRAINANNVRAILRECLCNLVACNNLQSVKFERVSTAEIAQ